MSNTMTVSPEVAFRDVLTQAEAEERARRVRDVSYELLIDLPGGRDVYRGDVTIRFDVVESGPLFLDFRGRAIELLEVNGRRLDSEWGAYRIPLPPDLVGRTTVRVVYENDYDQTGDGFHRFVDPEDDLEYVYSNFEPFEAHRLFPCFDQPDIKATYRLSVDAPAEWRVIGNARLASVDEAAPGRLNHRFEQTPPFSTYLVALVAGPFHVVEREHRGLPMGFYARRSMARYLDEQADEMAEITSQGLDYYSELFDQPYPFTKYDQLFVPEYNAGAMENVAAVTFNETYLFRDPPTDQQRLDRGEVILHELAHMWFGDLVTMRWWTDLWLNESFASYAAYDALSQATRFTNAWKAFNAEMKRWAYQQDQLVTTHPIAGEAPDTEVAFLNFDGITYGKGASVLKQLVAAIGRDGFRDGIRLYFRRHAWGNATLRDFLAALEVGSGRPLGQWAQLWLETASLNTISAEWDAEDGALRRLRLHQAAPAAHPVLRPHALAVGLGWERGNGLEVQALPTTISGAVQEVAEAVGRPEPVLVFPNEGDHAYAKIQLDDTTLDFVRRRLEAVEDALLRQLLWMSLWEMVRDTALRSTEFLEIARDKLAHERDVDILAHVLERARVALARFVPERIRADEAHRTFAAWRESLLAAQSGDAQIILARELIAIAETADDVAWLEELADGGVGVPGLTVDQEMRWGIAIRSVAFERPGADERVAAEERRDPSDRGRRAAIRARASRPTRDSKSETWRVIHGEGHGSFHLTRAAMQGFFWPSQAAVCEPFVDRFFEQVRSIFQTRDHPFARAYMTYLFPAYRADPRVLDRARALEPEAGNELPTLARQLAEAIDELERSIRVRAYAGEA